MALTKVIGLLLTACVLMGAAVTLSGTASSPPEGHLKVVRSDAHEILLELTVEGFGVEAVVQGGEVYDRLVIAGMVQTELPGAPQVPTRGALLGLPTAAGVSVELLEADYEILAGYRLPPAIPPEGAFAGLDTPFGGGAPDGVPLNRELDAADGYFPARLVALGQTGYLRDQAVAHVQFYPVQYNPATGLSRLYRRIVARVTWDAASPTETQPARRASPWYEIVLKGALLNYDALARPPVGGPAPASEARPAELVATLAASPTLKVGVDTDGLYTLTYTDVISAGLDLSAMDPGTIKLSNRGAPVPIHVTGAGDGAFDPTDVALFYGTAITDVYTSENVYWLAAGGELGQRMEVRAGAPAGASVPIHFPTTLHAEEDTFYWNTMPDGAGQDHYFWIGRISPSTGGLPTFRDFPLPLDNISTSGALSATLRVRLKGYTSLDHRTRIYLNGTPIDEQDWAGQIIFDHTVTFDHADLIDGVNTIRVEALETGAAVDQLLVNWIEIDYWDTYVAENDRLYFGPPQAGTFRFEVSGFGDDDVELFDVTDPANPVLITETAVLSDGGSYTLQFRDVAQPQFRYLAQTTARRDTPSSIVLDQPSLWRSPSNGADYIVITHADFYTDSVRLASHRDTTSGLRVATVKIQDVYDEFNYGIFNPGAIRNLLSYAYQNWTPPAPAFVVLVGDAYTDYRDNLHSGSVNFVPAQIAETRLFGQVPSDNWFVTLSGDDVLPDMFIGRLSARTAAEAGAMVDKIIGYDQSPPDDAWNKNVLLIADDDSATFELVSEQLADRVPYYYTVNRVYVDGYPPGDPTSDITDYVDAGSMLVNYVGHGEYFRWGLWDDNSKTIFGIADIKALNNPQKLPVVTVGNCLNGFFSAYNDQDTFAETLQRVQDTGAIAVWAPSSFDYPAGHQVLLREFYEAIFQEDQYALGAATTAAKIATFSYLNLWDELVQTFILFGDPATQLGIPTNYPYVESTTPADGAGDVPIDQPLRIIFSKPMVTSTVVLGGAGASSLPFTPTWSVDDTELTYAHPPFSYSQTLDFTIDGEDRLQNALGVGSVPAAWSFTVTGDDVPPTGTLAVEGGLLTEVPVTATVVITFSEPIRDGSVAASITPPVSGWLDWDVSREHATFRHMDFVWARTYTFTVTAARDMAGNPLLESLEITFATQGAHWIYLPFVMRGD